MLPVNSHDVGFLQTKNGFAALLLSYYRTIINYYHSSSVRWYRLKIYTLHHHFSFHIYFCDSAKQTLECFVVFTQPAGVFTAGLNIFHLSTAKQNLDVRIKDTGQAIVWLKEESFTRKTSCDAKKISFVLFVVVFFNAFLVVSLLMFPQQFVWRTVSTFPSWVKTTISLEEKKPSLFTAALFLLFLGENCLHTFVPTRKQAVTLARASPCTQPLTPTHTHTQTLICANSFV